MFSCGYCGIFKNTFFIEYLRWLLLPFEPTRIWHNKKKQSETLISSLIILCSLSAKLSPFTQVRSSLPEVFRKKGVLNVEISQNSQENTWARFQRPATLLKKGLWHRCFPVNFAKFLRTPFLREHLYSRLLSSWLFEALETKLEFQVMFFKKYVISREIMLLITNNN